MGLFKSHTTYNRADKISNFTVSTTEYGSAVPEIFGTTRISGNVIYYRDFLAHEHRESHRSGKGGHSKSVSITYTYTVAVILGLCEGPIESIGKVWRDKSVYNYPADDIQLTLFRGTANQKPWPYVTGKHPDEALPYEGLAYMAGVIDLGDSGSMPNFNFEVKGKLISSGDGVDANPADVIRYILDKVGLADVEIEGLDNYRNYCRENDLLVSSPMDDTNAKETQTIINEILTLTNAYMFWSVDRYKIIVIDTEPHGSWKPDNTILYDLTKDDFIPQGSGVLVSYSRKDSADVYNQYPVEFINRANSYEKETVSYALNEDIRNHGVRQADTTSAHWFYTKERAVKVAEALAKQAVYGRNQYTFKLAWNYCRLEPGDLVTLTDEGIGMEKEIVRLTSTDEGPDGLITYTAVSVPPMDATPAQYNIHDVERPYIDYNTTAPDTDTPVILQPPADLTQNGLEVWIGAKGKSDNWGGCNVYVSDDNTNYRLAGQISSSARIGTLAKAVGKDDTTIIVKSNGDFLSGSEQDAERGNTLCWLDGECFSYQTATMLADGSWQLTGCIRGQYNTTPGGHAAGSRFARLDNALLQVAFRREDIGKKVWLKFVSYNVFGAGEQDMAAVQAYEYTIQAYYIPPVRSLHAYNRYREQGDGVSRYDIVVEWEKPDMDSYLEGQVWYKTNNTQGETFTPKEGVPADEIGFTRDWQFAGSGETKVIIPQAAVGDTYRICVVTKDKWGAAASRDLAPTVDILVAAKTTIPNMPDNFALSFGAAATAKWDEVTNADIAWYEVRTDKNPGADTPGLMARTTAVSATLPLTNREGKVYLYARSAQGKYSYPAVLEYNKPAPRKPAAPIVTPKLGGMSIDVGSIPTDCIGVALYIEGADSTKVFRTANTAATYTCDAGVYNVRAAYYDLFGEGPKSDPSTVTVKIQISEDDIADQAVTKEKVDTTIQKAIEDTQQALPDAIGEAKQQAADIEAALNKLPEESGYKAIAELKTTTDSISSTVAANKTAQDGTNKNMLTQISQNAGAISSMAATLNGEPGAEGQYKAISAVKQTADSLAATVEANKTAQDGTNETLISSITQNTNAINSMVTVLNGEPGADNQYAAISSLKQTADSIASTVAANKTAQDGTNKTLQSSVKQNADSITALVTNLGDKDKAVKNYAAFSVMNDAIASKVTQDDVTSYFQQDHTGFYIKGSLIHVDGDTKFDKGVIAKNIEAGSIAADMLNVDKLSSVSADLGTVTAGTLKSVNIETATLKAADIESGSINADIIKQAGYEVKSVAVVTGTIHVDWGGVTPFDTRSISIPIPDGYKIDQCVPFTELWENVWGYYIEHDTYFEFKMSGQSADYWQYHVCTSDVHVKYNRLSGSHDIKYKVIGIK